MTNRLAEESSPYLLQHKHNPVDWYPWGEEALSRAREEDRPILLSIGYSSCHWCHVMERESFDDPNVARIMNESFVNVKVDREERPDVDSVYMRAVQAMTGQGGWPLTAFLTPEGVPFYGGTYFPPEPRHGLPSFPQVLEAAARAYRNRKAEVEKAGREMKALLERSSRSIPRAEGAESEGSAEITEGLLDDAADALLGRLDPDHGGFGSAPKFPQPTTLTFLLRRYASSGRDDVRDAVLLTLRRMASGGIRDHLAGGFHRYSVDARWLVPHFEKMLYDNALLAQLYLDAFRVTGEEALRAVAEEILDYVLDDLRSPEGGFYSARDADSEGEEGTFYLWDPEEVDEVLGDDDGALFKRVYDVTPDGNFEGRNILHLPHDLPAVAAREEMAEEELTRRLGTMKERLREVRDGREAPFRDEKILASWNGLTIRALVEAGAGLDRSDYREAGERAAELLRDRLRRDGRLLRVLKDEEARVDGFLEDYAALGNAFLTLHEVTLEPRWLGDAVQLAEEILDRFWDADEGILFDAPHDGEALVVRPRDPTDGATPSGNSMAVELLLRLGHLLDRDDLTERGRVLLAAEIGGMERAPAGFGWILAAAERAVAPGMEVAVVGPRRGPGAEGTRALLREVHRPFVPNKVVTGRAPDEEPELPTPLLEGREALEGRPTAYLCQGYACRAPTSSPEVLARQLKEVGASGG